MRETASIVELNDLRFIIVGAELSIVYNLIHSIRK